MLSVLDVPQAVGLALPRKVQLHVKEGEAKAWSWPVQLQKALGTTGLEVKELAE